MTAITRRAAIGGLMGAGLGPGAGSIMAAENFDSWLSGVKREAAGKGVRGEILERAFSGVRPIPRVIELDRRQAEFTLTFQQYLDRIVPASRIQTGRRRFAENRALLQEVGAAYGVQPRFIVALWGIETDFGRNTGGFSVIGALATLAHDGRRSSYFRKELMNALRILNEGHIAPEAMQGSWAGAMGQSQFMPSSFVAYAVDHDGDGRRDIWTTRADVFASAANYLAKAGWRADQTWGRPVRLPPGFDKSLADLKVRRRLSQWAAMGVSKADGSPLPTRDLESSIVIPRRSGGRAFVVYRNFRAIRRWNPSNFFALAVGRLADGIAGA